MTAPGPCRVPSRQRGAIGVLGAVVMLLVVLCIALALDTGRLYMEQRNLQRIADLAALEVASQADEGIAAMSDTDLTSLSVRSANVPDSVEGFLITAQGGGLCRETVELEERDPEGRRLRFAALSRGGRTRCADGTLMGRRTAVEVTASLETRASLLGGALAGAERVRLQATAVARQSPRQPLVTYRLGSRLLAVDGSGLLGLLLGNDIDVTALGYRGLANATLSVVDLIDLAADAGTADGVLEDVSLSLIDLAEISGLEALARHPSGDQEALRLGVRLFRDALEGFVSLGLDAVRLGELADIDPSRPDEALQAEVGLLHLLETMAFVGNGRFIDLEHLGLDLGILGGVELALQVIEPPQIAIGPTGCERGEPPCDGRWATQATTAQLALGAHMQIGVPLVSGLDVLVGIRGGAARGGIDDLRLIKADDASYELSAGAYHQPLGVDLAVGLSLLSGSGIDSLVGWMGTADPEPWEGTRMQAVDARQIWPSADPYSFEARGAGDVTQALLDEANTLSVTVELLGGSVTLPADQLLGALEPALTQLAEEVLTPVLELLGARPGEADMRIIELAPGTGGAELVI